MPLKTLLFGSFDEPDWDKLREAVRTYRENLYADSMAQFSELSMRGSLLSNVYIGMMYEKGESVPQNYSIALEMYYKSAEKDLPTAQFFLAQLQRKVGNYTDAVAWHKIAAHHGLVPSMYALFRLLQLSELAGEELDKNSADQYLYEASRAGHVFAQKYYALRMLQGHYGIKNVPMGLLLSVYAFVRGMIKLAQGKEPDLIS